MPTRRKQPTAAKLLFSIYFPYDLDGSSNDGMTGVCGLEFTPLHLVITGRRFTSEKHHGRIRHAYVISNVLLSSVIGVLAVPLVKLYADIRTHFLTQPARLVFDLDQICDVGGDRDVVGFSILGRDGTVKAAFCGNTALNDTGRINALLESVGHRVSRLPLP